MLRADSHGSYARKLCLNLCLNLYPRGRFVCGSLGDFVAGVRVVTIVHPVGFCTPLSARRSRRMSRLGRTIYREKEILQRFYGIGTREMTLEEIGDEYGLTRERVRQIKEKALRGLRKSSRSEMLKPYL